MECLKPYTGANSVLWLRCCNAFAEAGRPGTSPGKGATKFVKELIHYGDFRAVASHVDVIG